MSRGGEWGSDNVVDSCRVCNRLKGGRSVEQFRVEIETRLGEPVTFAGEATPGDSATDISSVRSFAAASTHVRLPEEVMAEARAMVLELRAAGYVTTTLGGLVSDAIESYRARLRNGELGPAQLGPQAMVLFQPSPWEESA